VNRISILSIATLAFLLLATPVAAQMTDLRATPTALVLAAEIDGQVLIHDAQGRVVVELQKSRGAPMTLGLGPERYQVTLQRGERHFQAMVDLGHGGQAMLTEAALQAATPELAVARGPAAPADAVSDEPPLVWATVSLIPPLSVSGFEARHHFALNLLAGAGSALDGVEIGGVANVRTRHVRGLQLAGVANWAGDLTGFQIGGAANVAAGSARGLQLAGAANWTGRDLTGFQIGGAINVAGGDVRGLQLAGAASVTGGGVRGLQVGGAASVAGGDVRGAQLGGAGNWAGGVTGFQIGGAANVAHDVRGAQISGAINVGGGLEGMQLSVLNIAGKVTGVQLGVINIAHSVRGVQLGVLNVADQVDGESIGLVSAVRNGHHAAEAWTSDLVPLLVGVKLGSRHVYSLFAAGATREVGHLGVGLGVHAPLGWMYLDVDATAYELQRFDRATSPTDLLAQGRVMLGVPIFPRVSIFGGAAINAAFAFDGMGEELSTLGNRMYQSDNVVLRLSPGLFAGVSLH
jgi:hypothetical protein